MTEKVRNNATLQRFELVLAGGTAVVTYDRSPALATLLPPEGPHQLEGHGVGSALARGTLESVRANGEEVVPKCAFIAAYIGKRAKFQDLVATASRHEEIQMTNATWKDRPSEPSVAPGTVVVTETGEGSFSQYLLDGRHCLLADEPVAAGGTDRGPGPYELLLMSLGACTAMTVRMYATRKKLPLERVTIRLKHAKVYLDDCIDCVSKPAMLDHIHRELEFAGPLSAEQKGQLMSIAEKCPVHRTLTSRIKVTTDLAA
jgi:putative redox protein